MIYNFIQDLIFILRKCKRIFVISFQITFFWTEMIVTNWWFGCFFENKLMITHVGLVWEEEFGREALNVVLWPFFLPFLQLTSSSQPQTFIFFLLSPPHHKIASWLPSEQIPLAVLCLVGLWKRNKWREMTNYGPSPGANGLDILCYTGTEVAMIM